MEIAGIEDLELIGEGGFARVYRGHQAAFRRDVAVKVVMLREWDESARARFQRECLAAGTVSSHPAIVTVFDSGETADGQPYLVMELMPGGSLADRIDADGPLPIDEAVEICARMADALHHAHERGVVHRDVKPANILFSAFGDARLGDFGISRVNDAYETRSGTISATLAHAAPEVVGGRPASRASDVYSLGSTLFAALVGSAPFVHETDEHPAALIGRIATAPVPDLRLRGFPAPLAEAIEKSLAKQPEQRPATAAEFADLLRRSIVRPGGEGSSSAPGERTTRALPEFIAVDEDGTEGQRARRVLPIAGAILALGLVIAAVALWWPTDSDGSVTADDDDLDPVEEAGPSAPGDGDENGSGSQQGTTDGDEDGDDVDDDVDDTGNDVAVEFTARDTEWGAVVGREWTLESGILRSVIDVENPSARAIAGPLVEPFPLDLVVPGTLTISVGGGDETEFPDQSIIRIDVAIPPESTVPIVIQAEVTRSPEERELRDLHDEIVDEVVDQPVPLRFDEARAGTAERTRADLSGTTSPGAVVAIGEREVEAGADGRWTTTVRRSDGSPSPSDENVVRIAVTATDPFGRQVTRVVRVRFATEAVTVDPDRSQTEPDPGGGNTAQPVPPEPEPEPDDPTPIPTTVPG